MDENIQRPIQEPEIQQVEQVANEEACFVLLNSHFVRDCILNPFNLNSIISVSSMLLFVFNHNLVEHEFLYNFPV